MVPQIQITTKKINARAIPKGHTSEAAGLGPSTQIIECSASRRELSGDFSLEEINHADPKWIARAI